MDVLITGASGFIGRALTARLRAGATLHDASGQAFQPTRLILADRAFAAGTAATDPAATGLAAGPALLRREGSLADPGYIASLVSADLACVFHLAGIVSGAAEADFDAGLQVNLDGTRQLLDALRADRRGPGDAAGRRVVRLVHTSSIAVYGLPIPARIDDDTSPWPTLSYGTQKLACELLINDLGRRGLVDGRSVRLSGVLVRPPIANGALSGFNSDLIREPMNGRSVVSPVSAAATLWVQSLDQTISNLIHAMNVEAAALGTQRALLLPALAPSIAEIVDAIAAVAGPSARGLITYQPDPAIEPMFGRWPKPFTATRALRMGFGVDADIEALVRSYAASM